MLRGPRHMRMRLYVVCVIRHHVIGGKLDNAVRSMHTCA